MSSERGGVSPMALTLDHQPERASVRFSEIIENRTLARPG